MGKRLIIAEKPSVGRDIANVLNCREKSTGYLSGDNDIVTWAVGHLVGLCSPDEMDAKYTDWKLEDLPIFPNPFFLKVLDSGAKQFEIIKSLMNKPDVDSIVCATDAGREGELIFRYIYQMVGCKKPVERLWISSLTYRAIKEGFENLKPDSAYDNLYKSARCRSEADWLIGMNGSRAYAITNQMKRLSVGRVLSPTLSILVKRELERRNFVPEEYCEVVAEFYGYEGKLLNEDKENTDEWSHFSIDQKEDLELFIKNRSSIGRICYVECSEEVQPPQQLYDLTSLQRDANRLYGMSSKWTLDTAQSLYEKHKATAGDCAKIYDLICDMECRELAFDRFQEIFCNQLNSNRYYCLVNDADDRVIAVLNLRFEEQLHHTGYIAEIMEFAVEAAFRNQRIGKGMLEEACRIARKQGCLQMEVACNQLREDTHRFYLREGMHNFHYKFSKSLVGNDSDVNAIGK